MHPPDYYTKTNDGHIVMWHPTRSTREAAEEERFESNACEMEFSSISDSLNGIEAHHLEHIKCQECRWLVFRKFVTVFDALGKVFR